MSEVRKDMSFFEKIVEGVKVVAPTVANIALPGSGTIIEKLMRKVTGDTTSDIEVLAAQIENDPKLFLELQRDAMAHETSLAQVEAAKLESVNTTMREESKSEHWPQYSWRPFNGFSFPLAILLIYWLLPMLGKIVPDVPEMVWIGWLSILGVATWDRGKEKRSKAGELNPGIIANTIKAIRG
jgi:hypothetical protein